MSDGRRPRTASGFTLLEVMVAFLILATSISAMVVIQSRAVRGALRAIELRDVRKMADTMFRKIVYEIQLYHDGDSGTGDVGYADFAGLRQGYERDRWRSYRWYVHKTRGMIAGSDPSGRYGDLFTAADSTSSSSYPTSTTHPPTSSGSSATDPENSAGEDAYLVALDVFGPDDGETPALTLRSVVPIPAAEKESGR